MCLVRRTPSGSSTGLGVRVFPNNSGCEILGGVEMFIACCAITSYLHPMLHRLLMEFLSGLYLYLPVLSATANPLKGIHREAEEWAV